MSEVEIISMVIALAISINGDHTAKSLGRLKLNPLVHIDPVGSILVPGMLFFSGSPFIFG